MACTSSDITKKKKVLKDFGVSAELLDELFENKEFVSLRALDVFANNILQNIFQQETDVQKRTGRKVG